MLRTCRRFHHRSFSLNALYEPDSQPGRKIRILSVSLMPPAPARITEDIDVRGPERKPLIDIPVAVSGISVIFRPSLCRDDISDLLHDVFVKCRRHPDRLRKHRCRSRPCHTVQCLIPIIISRNAEPLHRSGVVLKLRRLLHQGHLCH